MQHPLNLDKHLEPEVCSGMDDIRREIDHIDRTIVSLIGRRAEVRRCCRQIQDVETSVRAPETLLPRCLCNVESGLLQKGLNRM